jgi:hypothetical protein
VARIPKISLKHYVLSRASHAPTHLIVFILAPIWSTFVVHHHYRILRWPILLLFLPLLLGTSLRDRICGSRSLPSSDLHYRPIPEEVIEQKRGRGGRVLLLMITRGSINAWVTVSSLILNLDDTFEDVLDLWGRSISMKLRNLRIK